MAHCDVHSRVAGPRDRHAERCAPGGHAQSPAAVTAYPEVLVPLETGHCKVEAIRPSDFQIVMGASGKPSREVHLEAISAMNIGLFRRKGGGGTVLLGPHTVVVTVWAGVTHPFRNGAYFAAINRALIQVFRTWLTADYQRVGVSDIAVDGKKIVGSSIYRKRHLLLYQASILIEAEADLMERVLKPPMRQPQYRRQRPHTTFVTSFRRLGVNLPVPRLIDDVRRLLPDHLVRELAQIDPAFSKGALD